MTIVYIYSVNGVQTNWTVLNSMLTNIVIILMLYLNRSVGKPQLTNSKTRQVRPSKSIHQVRNVPHLLELTVSSH